MDMNNMGGGGGGDRRMMMMVFQNTISTPLYSSGWTPAAVGTYAGTCIFLVLLAALFRGMMASKHLLEQRWLDRERDRRYVVVRGRQAEAAAVLGDADAKPAMLLIGERGVEEAVTVVRRSVRPATAWRFSVDLPRATYSTLLVGVGYLLMLAVMTMNVGYFLSVLAGTFVGELAVGRFLVAEEH